MKSFFTPDDLILFAYSESDENENKSFYQLLLKNNELRHDYKNILSMKYFIDTSHVAPEVNTVANILNYAKALLVVKSRNAGIFNLLMN
jgi:hypothetical protein